MNKKIVVLLLAAVIVACVQLAQAQQPKKVPRIGFLSPLSSAAASLNLAAFRNSLRELGHVEGKTIVIESSFADGKLDRLSELAAELVRLRWT